VRGEGVKLPPVYAFLLLSSHRRVSTEPKEEFFLNNSWVVVKNCKIAVEQVSFSFIISFYSLVQRYRDIYKMEKR
jgi:hypothetical protein